MMNAWYMLLQSPPKFANGQPFAATETRTTATTAEGEPGLSPTLHKALEIAFENQKKLKEDFLQVRCTKQSGAIGHDVN